MHDALKEAARYVVMKRRRGEENMKTMVQTGLRRTRAGSVIRYLSLEGITRTVCTFKNEYKSVVFAEFLCTRTTN